MLSVFPPRMLATCDEIDLRMSRSFVVAAFRPTLMSEHAAQHEPPLASRQRENGTAGLVGEAPVKGHTACCAAAYRGWIAARRHRAASSLVCHLRILQPCLSATVARKTVSWSAGELVSWSAGQYPENEDGKLVNFKAFLTWLVNFYAFLTELVNFRAFLTGNLLDLPDWRTSRPS